MVVGLVGWRAQFPRMPVATTRRYLHLPDLLISLIWTGARGYGQVGCHAHWHIGPSSELYAHAMSTLRNSVEKMKIERKEGGLGGIKNFLLHRYTVLEWLFTEQLILFIPDPPFLSCILPCRYACAINRAVRMRTHYAHQPVNPLLHVNCV